jgi:hypothetical protein
MYELYCEQLKEDGAAPVSSSYYRDVFNTQYNLSFHKLKKDQCLVCSRYQDLKRSNEMTEACDMEYKEHQKRKIESRKEKEKDKERAKEEEHVHTATFDMEAVLATPNSQVSQVHYKRKFAVYNLTMYSLGDAEATCYVWDESDGNKGSCEVATCLYRYLQSLPRSVTHVILYSDTCGGQNRNKYVAAALQFAVKTIKNIKIIDQKFLESGHSHMECDSMHAAIEKAKKNATIFVPAQWYSIFGMARNPPYTVIPLEHSYFLDFKFLAKRTMVNTKKDEDKEPVSWLKLKWIRYTEDDNTLLFKYNIPDEFKELKNKKATRRGRQQTVDKLENIPRLYPQRLPIASAKMNDLMDLCKLGIIPPR